MKQNGMKENEWKWKKMKEKAWQIKKIMLQYNHKQ